MTATLLTRHRPGEDDERLARHVAALEELAAALGLNAPPLTDTGGNYSFSGISATELRGKLATVQTDTFDLFDGVTESD
jgi:hypothetical protein